MSQATVITPCPFYSDVFERVALQQSTDFTALSPAVKCSLDHFSRMLIMISTTEQSLSAMHSGTKLAMRGNISLDDLLLEIDSVVSFSDVETPVSSLVSVSSTAWLRSLSPPVTPELQPAVEWANQLPDHTQRSHDPEQFDDSLYEVFTVLNGSAQFGELKNAISQFADKFTDKELLSDNVPHTTLRQQTEVIGHKNMCQWANETRGKIVDQGRFRDQLLQSIATQLASLQNKKHDKDVIKLQHCIQTRCIDRQGRQWMATFEQRTVMANHGAFHYSTRAIHSWRPICARSEAMLLHFASKEIHRRKNVFATQPSCIVVSTESSTHEQYPEDSLEQMASLDFDCMFEGQSNGQTLTGIRQMPAIQWTGKGIAAIRQYQNFFPQAFVGAPFTSRDLAAIKLTRPNASTMGLIQAGVIAQASVGS